MKIYISGLYCGTNPQPGVGLSRSLRAAYPGATLVGVDYSNRSSGLHWRDFDELWLQRPWEELNLTAYGEQIREVLDAGALWISGNDLEIMWLGSVFPEGHPNLLTPPLSALAKTSKPAIEASAGLPVKIPTFISTEESDWELHTFCRKFGWKVWLKGPYYDASRARSWPEFNIVRSALSRVWATDRLFLQSHVTGYEESVALSAYHGEILECVSMRKREVTEENKTWAGDISDVPEEFMKPLREAIRRLNWTGGAELEMVRDAEGQLWLLEMNPRFPAWIHGATIAGRNVVGRLVEGATGIKMEPTEVQSEEFTRIVLEVPVGRSFPLPPLPEPLGGGIGHSLKHPSGIPKLAERLQELNLLPHQGGANGNGHAETKTTGAPDVPPSFVADLDAHHFDEMETPEWLFLASTAADLFKRASDVARTLTTAETQVAHAYSIKTNPDERMIKLAYESGFYAEAISLLEVRKALDIGFKPEQVILNGPGKWWPEGLLPKSSIHAVFCDSIADVERVRAALEDGELQSKIVGVRLRTPHIESRFGIPINTPEDFRALVEAVESLPRQNTFGVHFHMASSNIGVQQWWHLYEAMLRWCKSIEGLTGRRIECLDVGGGWFPDDWHANSDDQFAGAVARARKTLPSVRQIISEPGKALAQPSMAVAMRLLEIQETGGEVREAVVDGSIAELPMHFFQPHRVLRRDSRTGRWQALGRGQTRLMGRLCMEHDVVAEGVELPEDARVGDLLVFCDAGAYDRSMSYVFGRG
jgi:diaminopimelate decarboxylase